jgi:3-deoxy-manno-octulosonate cytidylyltransferase (CMP-KDO synthetase)
VIPARYASSRFPGKPLAPILGRPMIQWVWQACLEARSLDDLVVATDDDRIASTVRAFGGRVEMTRADHESGSDRLAEVASRHGAELLVNIQGDEPLMDGSVIDAVVALLKADPECLCATAVTGFRDRAELDSPDTAKVILDHRDRALYFSRAPIPFCRDGQPDLGAYHKHIGIYGYRRPLVARLGGLASRLEAVERLEQLRLLENGVAIHVARVAWQPLGVDRPADIAAVEALLGQR